MDTKAQTPEDSVKPNRKLTFHCKNADAFIFHSIVGSALFIHLGVVAAGKTSGGWNMKGEKTALITVYRLL